MRPRLERGFLCLGKCPLVAGSCRSMPLGKRLLWVSAKNCRLLLRNVLKLSKKLGAKMKRGGEQKSLEYLMCAPLKGFPTPKKCLFKGQ